MVLHAEETMERRQFLAASVAASTFAMAADAMAQPQTGAALSPSGAPSGREYYHVRRYALQTGPQTKATESFFGDALIPALARMGMGPVGAFRLDIGPETPAYYLLIPGSRVEALAELDLRLAQDGEFMMAGEAYWNATAAAPAFGRVDGALLKAFEGWPKLTPPASSATKAKRIFQLRTYESPSYGEHVRKVEMFHAGEFDIFRAGGFRMVFFGDTIVGTRMPSLTYMLTFADLAELTARWAAFGADPAWKELSQRPGYTDPEIVSNITNLYLSPLSCSQI
jgi:hypothetical protein